MDIVQLSMFDGKVCVRCKQEKPKDQFHRCKRFSDGLRRWCKECEKAYKRERYAKDSSSILEYNNKFRREHRNHYLELKRKSYKKHQADISARTKEDRKINPEKYRRVDRKRYTNDPRKFREYQRVYRAANRDKRNVWHHTRRSRSKAGGGFTTEQWAMLCIWFGNECLACGAKETTVDHVIPLSLKGTNTIDNLQPLCNPCNNRKHAKIVDYRDPILLSAFLEHIQCLEHIEIFQASSQGIP